MTDTEEVDRLARALHGQYGGTSVYSWNRAADSLREQWRVDARALLAEFRAADAALAASEPGAVSAVALMLMAKALRHEKVLQRMALRHATQRDIEVAEADRNLARWKATEAEAAVRRLQRSLRALDAVDAGAGAPPMGEPVSLAQARFLPGGSVLIGPDGWVAQRDMSGIDAWFVGNESSPLADLLFEGSAVWRLVLVGEGGAATDDEY